MCLPGQQAAPASAADAMEMVLDGLGWLAAANATALTCAEQAECLRGLERAGSMRIAARASVLRAFSAAAGYEADGQGSARTWLRWQTRVSTGAAAAAMAWARRLAAHRAVYEALAAGTVTESFARQICEWSDVLPEAHRAGADAIWLDPAAGGAELADLAALAQEIRQRTARPDAHGDEA